MSDDEPKKLEVIAFFTKRRDIAIREPPLISGKDLWDLRESGVLKKLELLNESANPSETISEFNDLVRHLKGVAHNSMPPLRELIEEAGGDLIKILHDSDVRLRSHLEKSTIRRVFAVFLEAHGDIPEARETIKQAANILKIELSKPVTPLPTPKSR